MFSPRLYPMMASKRSSEWWEQESQPQGLFKHVWIVLKCIICAETGWKARLQKVRPNKFSIYIINNKKKNLAWNLSTRPGFVDTCLLTMHHRCQHWHEEDLSYWRVGIPNGRAGRKWHLSVRIPWSYQDHPWLSTQNPKAKPWASLSLWLGKSHCRCSHEVKWFMRKRFEISFVQDCGMNSGGDQLPFIQAWFWKSLGEYPHGRITIYP